MLKAWLGLLIVAVAARALVTGSVVDLGMPLMGWSAAVVAAGLGVGALTKRVPSLFDALVLAVGITARGMVAAGCVSVFGTGPFGWGLALVASLAVPAFMLGRFASVWIRGRSIVVALAWVTGELLVVFGVVASWPGVATGPVAALLAFLLTRGAADETADVAAAVDAASEDAAAPSERVAVAEPLSFGVLAAGLLGASLTLALLVMRRVMPGYTAPTVHATSEWIIALLVPAVVIAMFVAVLVGNPKSWSGRIARLAGGVGVAVALIVMFDASTSYQVNGHIALTRQLRGDTRAYAETFAWLRPWDLWVTSFIGYLAAGFGIVLGAVRGRASAGFALGAAVAFAGEAIVIPAAPVFGPTWMLLASVGLAGWSGVVGVFGIWGLLAAPIAAAGFWMRDDVHWSGYDEMRRPGELSAEAHVRSASTETLLFSSPLLGTTSPEGTLAYLQTSIGRKPLFPVYESAFEKFDAKVRQMEDEAKEGLMRRFGVRIAGVTAHPGHPALGEDGSVGRMLRLFGRAGEALIVGYGAELIGLDWSMVDGVAHVGVATPSADRDGTRMGDYLLVLADVTETKGLSERVEANVPFTLARAFETRGYDVVVVAPERPEWPGAGASLTVERLGAIRAALASGGRCLAWIDTMSLDAASLRARLAAFGTVFGERSVVLVEPRGLDAPFVVAIGWSDDEGDPHGDVLVPGTTRGVELSGLRTTLRSRDELDAHVILDGRAMVELAASAGAHSRDRFVVPSRFARTGWSAVASVYDTASRWAPDTVGSGTDALPKLMEALEQHASYSFHLAFVNQTVVENLGDIDWDAYDTEVALLIEAAQTNPKNSLVQFTIASLGEQLVVHSETTRFASLYEAVGAEAMESWRLQLLKAAALDHQLEPELAADAMARARELAGLDPLR